MGARPRESSSTTRIFGRETSAWASTSICCSPPERERADGVSARLEPRKELVRVGDAGPRILAGERVRRDAQVVLDRQVVEHAPALGDDRDARRAYLLGTRAGQIPLAEEHLPRTGAENPGDREHEASTCRRRSRRAARSPRRTGSRARPRCTTVRPARATDTPSSRRAGPAACASVTALPPCPGRRASRARCAAPRRWVPRR